MAYATVEDVQARLTRQLSESEIPVVNTLLDDAAMIIDSFGSYADNDIKCSVSARMVVRAIGDGGDAGIPVGSTQGSMSALGYSQSWTIGGGGSAGELYLSKAEKKMLGLGTGLVGSHSPVEDRAHGQNCPHCARVIDDGKYYQCGVCKK